MKQTAIKWLIEYCDRENWSIPNNIIEQAKAMEKEQIKDAHLIGLITSMEMEATKQAEYYYNETFKSE